MCIWNSWSKVMRYSVLTIIFSLIAGSLVAVNADQGPIPVEIRGEPGKFQLYRGGMPYVVRGAGVAVHEPDGRQLMEELRARGGNSLRTWNVGDGKFLDDAQELGLTVALCLDVARERHGFDYDDPIAVQNQLERFEQQVRQHRDHPALLAWVIGNELNHDFTNPRVYDAVNDISKMIHELDPNHPTTTTTAVMDKELADIIVERAPDLDFVSIQVYGALFVLDDLIADLPDDLPVMVTEWGTLGHWEVGETDWGAPIELNSTQKARIFLRGYVEALAPLAGRVIGDYVFIWGQKQERTPTWYGMFVDGAPTQAVGVMQRIWTRKLPTELAPSIERLRLNGKVAEDNIRLLPGGKYEAEVTASDSESETLSYSWRMLEESRATQRGGDFEETPPEVSHYLGESSGAKIKLRAPEETGAYRLFVYVHDESGSVAHANIPFLSGRRAR